MASLSADTIFHLGPLPVTNTMLDILLVDAILIGIAIYIAKRHTLVPGFFQTILEMLIEAFNDMIKSVAGDRTKKIFPYVMTFFLFILLTNWTGLTPILTGIGIMHDHELIPLIRSGSTDLNVTIALALVSIVATHNMSVRALGIKEYIGRFISLNPLFLFIGLLELILEFAKIISFSLRLFGNVFVGKVLLHSASGISLFLIPIPVMIYEMFIGAVQAAIFARLAMAFMAILTTSHKSAH